MSSLFISDLHAPYHHRDAYDFLYAMQEYYQFENIYNVGDVVDNHIPNYHEKELDAFSGSEEVEEAGEFLRELQYLFPVMKISLGNHDIMANRKAKTSGIPQEWVKCPNAVYGLKRGWDWDVEHNIVLGDGSKAFMRHSIGVNMVSNVKGLSRSSIQGHHHSALGVVWREEGSIQRFHMSVGCLIDPKAPPFRYDKDHIKNRPLLGCGFEIDGVAYVQPMRLKNNGRWVGKI